jgi:hypothetical protein
MYTVFFLHTLVKSDHLFLPSIQPSTHPSIHSDSCCRQSHFWLSCRILSKSLVAKPELSAPLLVYRSLKSVARHNPEPVPFTSLSHCYLLMNHPKVILKSASSFFQVFFSQKISPLQPCVYSYFGSEVLTAVVMKSSAFWDITPCSPLRVNRRFGETCRFHL